MTEPKSTPTHTPGCSATVSPWLRAHFVEVRPCCKHDAAALRVLLAEKDAEVERLRHEVSVFRMERDHLLEAIGEVTTGEMTQQWAVFYGGPDADNAAGRRTVEDEADAREQLSWVLASHGKGIAVREVRCSPWRTVHFEGSVPDGD